MDAESLAAVFAFVGVVGGFVFQAWQYRRSVQMAAADRQMAAAEGRMDQLEAAQARLALERHQASALADWLQSHDGHPRAVTSLEVFEVPAPGTQAPMPDSPELIRSKLDLRSSVLLAAPVLADSDSASDARQAVMREVTSRARLVADALDEQLDRCSASIASHQETVARAKRLRDRLVPLHYRS